MCEGVVLLISDMEVLHEKVQPLNVQGTKRCSKDWPMILGSPTGDKGRWIVCQKGQSWPPETWGCCPGAGHLLEENTEVRSNSFRLPINEEGLRVVVNLGGPIKLLGGPPKLSGPVRRSRPGGGQGLGTRALRVVGVEA